jgi:hypothetical protein
LCKFAWKSVLGYIFLCLSIETSFAWFYDYANRIVWHLAVVGANIWMSDFGFVPRLCLGIFGSIKISVWMMDCGKRILWHLCLCLTFCASALNRFRGDAALQCRCLGAWCGGHPVVPLSHHRMIQNATVYGHWAMFFCRPMCSAIKPCFFCGIIWLGHKVYMTWRQVSITQTTGLYD